MTGPDANSSETRRVDLWLWYARFAKTRSLAGRLCTTGALRLNGVPVSKPNQKVRRGDVLIVPQGRVLRTVTIVALGERRGPAPAARALYEEYGSAVPTATQHQWEPLLGG